MANEGSGAGKTIMIVLVVVGALLLVCGGGCCAVSIPVGKASANLAQVVQRVMNSHPGTMITMLPKAPGENRLYLVAGTPGADEMSDEEIAALQDEIWTLWSDEFSDGGAFPVVGVGIGVPGGPQGVTGWTDRIVEADTLVERTGKAAPETSWVWGFMPAEAMTEGE